MNFELTIKNQTLLIAFKGKLLGMNQGVDLFTQVEHHLAEGSKNIAADLSDLALIDSSGIGMLMRLLTKARNQGGDMVLIQPSEKIRQLLLITKLMAIFTIVDNQNEAFKCFEAS